MARASHMAKRLPRHAPNSRRAAVRALARDNCGTAQPETPYEEIERQNQELLKTLTGAASAAGGVSAAEPRVGRHEPRRGGSLCRTGRARRLPAAGIRAQNQVSLQRFSRVSHAPELHHLAVPSADGQDGRRVSSEQEKQVRYIESSARDLQEMVNDLLDLAKVEAGKIKIRVKTFEVHEFSAL